MPFRCAGKPRSAGDKAYVPAGHFGAECPGVYYRRLLRDGWVLELRSDSAQLSTYYVGTSELDQLRVDYVRKYGPIRDLMDFHDKILSFGSPAPKYLRELMGL